MKYFSAFTGVGGFDLGMPPEWECVGHSEIDKYANMVLKYRFRDVKNYGDAEKIDWKEVPDFDMLVVGSLRREPPLEVLFEPVNSGSVARIQEQPINTITRRYYGAQATGSYVVEGEFNAQKIDTVHNSKSQIKRIYGINGVAPTLHRYTGGHQDIKMAIPVLTPSRIEKRQNGRRFKENGEPSFTITRQDKQGIFDGKIIRTLTPLECERLMGWPDNWTKWGIDENGNTVELSDTQRYNLIGNGVVPQIVSQIIENMPLTKLARIKNGNELYA